MRALVLIPSALRPRIDRAMAILGWDIASAPNLMTAIAAMHATPDTPALLCASLIGDMQAIRDWQVHNLLFVLTGNAGSPREQMLERAAVLSLGADDAQPLDIDPRELAARLEALMRRRRPVEGRKIELPGEAYFDSQRSELVRGNAFVRLTGLEERMFLALADKPDAIVTKEAMMFSAYGLSPDRAKDKIVDTIICKVRRKIADLGIPDPIENIWGEGYRFCQHGRPATRKEMLARREAA